ADDHAFDGAVRFVRALDVAPHDELERLLSRQVDRAGLAVGALEVDVDVVALVDGELAVARRELVGRGLAFALVADVDGDRVAADPHHTSRDDFTRLRTLEALLEEGRKILLGAGRVAGLVSPFGHQTGTPCARS